MADEELTLVNDVSRRRWEARLGDELVGFAEYRASDTRIVFIHTVVEPRHEGKGIGSRLARAALDDAVQRGQRIVSRCPFISAYLIRHPEYAAAVEMPAEPPPAD